MSTVPRKPSATPVIDNTDWLKFAAIIFVAIDHFGYFFVVDNEWWSVWGRLAAPTFFFLIGFAQSRTVPLRWILLGGLLTLLEFWNTDDGWVTPNILFSLALVRILRPYVLDLLQRYSWITFALLVSVLLIILPSSAQLVDYGAEGWLWSLFGLCQRIHADSASTTFRQDQVQTLNSMRRRTTESDLMRLIAGLFAASIYVWQEQLEFVFSNIHLAGCIIGVSILSIALLNFRRRPSFVQPPTPIAQVLLFIGRHTLEIYAIQLGGSELIVMFFPELAA